MVYITFEGIDGSGKSTQYKRQVERLRGIHGDENIGEYAYSAKNNPVGKIIKKAYRHGVSHPLSFLTNRRSVQEVLYALNARQNLRSVRDSEDRILVSDRSVITAYASHIDLLPEWFVSLAEPALYPDLAIFLQVPPEIGHQRLDGRETLFTEEDLEGLRLFDDNYKKVLGERRPRTLRHTVVETIDSNRSLDEVTRDVSRVVDSWIERHYHTNGARLNGKA